MRASRRRCSIALLLLGLGLPSLPALAAPTPAPSGLAAAALSQTQVHLSWLDNSTRERAFVIERSAQADTGFVRIGRVPRDTTSFDDFGLTAGTTYFYRVKAKSRKGPSPYSNVTFTATLAEGANVPPIADAGTDREVDTLTVLSFDGSASSDADGSITSYVWDFGDESTASGRSTAHAFARPGLYSVQLTVVDNRGGTGSAVSLVSVGNREPAALAGSDQWADPSIPLLFEGAGSTDPDGSIVSYSWDFGDGTSVSETGASHLYTQTGTFPVTITVTDDLGAATTDTLTVRVAPAVMATTLSSPTTLGANVVSSSRISLSWTDNSPDESGFKIERADSPSGPWSQLATTLSNATSYMSVWLEPSRTYSYRVRAFNASGSSEYSNVASATTLGASAVPNPPTALQATAMSTDRLDLRWTDASSDELGFKVERATASAGPFIQIATSVGAAYSDGGLTPATTCYYRVRAYNATGDSAYTAVAYATTHPDAAPPSAPSGLAAAAVSPRQISLGWTDRSDDETGFKIERARSGIGDWTQIALTGSNVTGYSDTGLTPSSSYDYRMRAYNAIGDSDYSAPATAATPAEAVVPDPPAGLTAAAVSSTRVNLSWTDGSTNEGGFRIERAAGAGRFTTLVSTGPNVVSYADTGVSDSTSYSYRVAAFNATGESNFSNTASATTPAGADRTAPSVPTGARVTAPACGLARLTWNGSTDSGGSGLKGYNIYRRNIFLRHVPASDPSLVIDAGLPQATYYYYAVSAVDNANNESARTSPAGTYTQSCSGGGGDFGWARTFGGSMAPDGGAAIAVDRDGSIFVTGDFRATANLGGSPLTSAGYRDVFVAKFRADGTHVWSKSFGGAFDDFGKGIAVDARGDVVVGGLFLRTADFGGGPLNSAGGYDTFLVKLSGENGAHIWSKRIGGTSDDRPAAIGIDGAGNIVVTGQFNGAADFGSGVPTSNVTSTRAYLAKYAGTDGAYLWARVFESSAGAAFGSGQGVAIDGGGNLIVTGYFQGTVNFGGTPVTSAGGLDVFVAKFTTSGTHVWSRAFGDASDQHGQAVAVDSAGNVVVTGDFLSSIDFGGGPLDDTNTAPTIFLASLGPDGSHRWSRSFTAAGLNGGSFAYGVAVDGADRIALTGLMSGPVDFGGGPLGVSTIFLSKFERSGSHVWSKSYRSGGGSGRGVATGADGTIVATGSFTTVVDLGGGEMRSNGSTNSDAFVLSLAP